MRNVCFKKALVVGILIFFVGAVVVPAIATPRNTTKMNENIIIKVDPTGLDPKFTGQNAKEANSLENSMTQPIPLSFAEIMYGYLAYGGESGERLGPCYLSLDDPSDIISLQLTGSLDFIAGGTWTSDERWLGCEFQSGALWELDPKDGDMLYIGGGGTGCNGLAWDPVDNRLYGTDGLNLIEYDPDTGEQEVIGSHNINQDKLMIALAINMEGICYAWNIHYSDNASLYTIDLETGEATEVGSMGEPLVFAQDGAFDWDSGILYLSAYYQSGFLATVDTETGLLTRIGDFEGGAEITGSIIGAPLIPPEPPTAPTITGPTHGRINIAYSWTFLSDDPNGGLVRYYIQWRDGNYETTGWYPAGTPVDVYHTYTTQGTYEIVAFAEDETGLDSPYSFFLVTMPRNRAVTNSLLLWFLEQFSLLERLFHLIK